MRDYLLYPFNNRIAYERLSIIYPLTTGLFFTSCSVKEKSEQPTGNAPVEISLALEDFVSVSGTERLIMGVRQSNGWITFTC